MSLTIPSSPKTFFIRVTILYRQKGSIALDKDGKVWKDYDTGITHLNLTQLFKFSVLT